VRILIANANRGVVGGAETYLAGLLPALLSRGHSVALLSEWEPAPGQSAVDAAAPGVECWSGQGEPAAASERLAAWRPDVVFLHGMFSATLETALVGRFPTVLFAHNYYGTCISGTKLQAFPLPRPCDRVFGAGCLLRYLPCRCGGGNPLTGWRLYARQKARHDLLPEFRAVLVASEHMRQEYRRHGVPAERLHLVPYFLTAPEWDPAPPAPRPFTGRVLYIGRLTNIKGGLVLVRALRRAQQRLGRPLALVVAGDGPERPRIQALAGRLGVRAEFAGWIDAARRTELMRGADVLAVPSLWPEPFGLVGIEAGCVGLPAVAFPVGGITDWLVPGESGELAAGDRPTVAGLADALVRALRDPAHRARLGEGAWRKAREFTLDGHVARLESLLEVAARDAS
jgi:glycosyltransferase involved in cell wall biosynthesis